MQCLCLHEGTEASQKAAPSLCTSVSVSESVQSESFPSGSSGGVRSPVHKKEWLSDLITQSWSTWLRRLPNPAQCCESSLSVTRGAAHKYQELRLARLQPGAQGWSRANKHRLIRCTQKRTHVNSSELFTHYNHFICIFPCFLQYVSFMMTVPMLLLWINGAI